jgi:hypothetical protein
MTKTTEKSSKHMIKDDVQSLLSLPADLRQHRYKTDEPWHGRIRAQNAASEAMSISAACLWLRSHLFL